jgi:hypothetical protein
MFWDKEGDSKEEQTFKNLVYLDMPLNNKDRDELMESPIMGLIALILIIAFIVMLIVRG